MNAPSPIVHIYVLLDHSGSMSAMAEQVVAGFNRLLAEQQADGHDARMTLVQFDDVDPREVVFEAIPLAEVVPLRSQDFEPRGMTPLLDATGGIIHRAAQRAAEQASAGQPPEQVLVVTITDGEENHSQEFTRRRVVELVRAKEAEGWTFAFLGAGLDAYQRGRLDGLPARVRSVVPARRHGRRDRLHQPLGQDRRPPRQAAAGRGGGRRRLLRGRQACGGRPSGARFEVKDQDPSGIEDDLDHFDPVAYIERVEWRFAKTMPDNPHWYTVRPRPPAPDDPGFESMVRLIRRDGRVRLWHGRPFTYLVVGEWDYWTMGEPIDETVIINRKRTDENDWDDE